MSFTYSQAISKFNEFYFSHLVYVSNCDCVLYVYDLWLLKIQLNHNIVETLLDKRGKLNVTTFVDKLSFYLTISVTNYCNEHVQEYEKYKEHICDKVDGTKNMVWPFQFLKSKIPKYYTKESVALKKYRIEKIKNRNKQKSFIYLHSHLNRTKFINLSAKT